MNEIEMTTKTSSADASMAPDPQIVFARPSLDDAGLVPIDVDRLIESGLLIQANSGGGKSWALRRVLEQTYGLCQHIVLDIEGEFHTLREKFDYVIAGGDGGDYPATVEGAALWARRLLETRVSAILDLYELGIKRAAFIERFLTALIHAPRALWHPVLVVIDEANLFCPEGAGLSDVATAVINLMTLGRKRGFRGVLATQRISTLHKSAAAEANNKLIGRCGLDVDMKRAGRELGFDVKQMAQLRKLRPGRFFAYGPALSEDVVEVQIGAVTTTHPRAGERSVAPVPPSAAIRKVLAQIGDLPKEAAAEAQTVDELRALVRELEARSHTSSADASKASDSEIAIAALRSQLEEEKRWSAALEDVVESASQELANIADSALERRNGVIDRMESAAAERPNSAVASMATDHLASVTNSAPVSKTGDHKLPNHRGNPATDAEPRDMERWFLSALAMHSDGLSRRQILLLTGYAAGGTTNAKIADLARRKLIAFDANRVATLTLEGAAYLGRYTPLPTGIDLRQYYLAKTSTIVRSYLQVLFAAYPGDVARSEILRSAGYSAGGTSNQALAYLVRQNLATISRKGRLRAAEELFAS